MNRKREIPEIFESKTFLDPTYEPGFREVFKDAVSEVRRVGYSCLDKGSSLR